MVNTIYKNRSLSGPVKWALLAFVVAYPLYGFSLYNVAGRGILRVDWLFGSILIAVFIASVAAGKSKLRTSSVNKFVVLYLTVSLLSLINLIDARVVQVVDFWTKAIQMLFAAGLFFVISSVMIGVEGFRGLLQVWIVTATFIALYAVYQLFARLYGWPLAYLELSNPTFSYGYMTGRSIIGYSQIQGVFKEPSWLASYLIGPITLTSVFILDGKDDWLLSRSRLVNLSILFLLCGAFFVSGSAAGFITLVAVVGGASAWAVFHRVGFRYMVRLLQVGLLVLVPLTVFIVLGGQEILSYFDERFGRIAERLVNLTFLEGNTSLARRARGLLEGIRVWLEHPVLGVGMNNFVYHSRSVVATQNAWAELLADRGALGFLSMLGIYGSALVLLLRRWQRKISLTWPSGTLILGLVLILVSDMVNAFFTLTWVIPQRWFTLGLANLLILKTGDELHRRSECTHGTTSTAPESPDTP